MNREEVLTMGIDPGAEYVGCSMAKGWESPVVFEFAPPVFINQLEGTTVTRVAIERFDMRQFTLESMATVKLIGVIEYLCWKQGIKIGYVNASDKRKFAAEALDRCLVSSRHIRDAEAIRLYDLTYNTW